MLAIYAQFVNLFTKCCENSLLTANWLLSGILLSQTAASYASTGVAFASNVAAAGGAFASSPASLRVTTNNIGNTSLPLVSGTRGHMREGSQ